MKKDRLIKSRAMTNPGLQPHILCAVLEKVASPHQPLRGRSLSQLIREAGDRVSLIIEDSLAAGSLAPGDLRNEHKMVDLIREDALASGEFLTREQVQSILAMVPGNSLYERLTLGLEDEVAAAEILAVNLYYQWLRK